MSYTIRHENTLTGSAHFQGVYESREEADNRVNNLVECSRKYVRFVVWTGKPREPGEVVSEARYGKC